MDVLQCSRCGSAYTPERDQAWGRTKGSDGYGPAPRCTAIVPALYAPKTATGETPGQVCGGQLVAKTEEAALASATLRTNNAELLTGDKLRVIAEEPIVARRA